MELRHIVSSFGNANTFQSTKDFMEGRFEVRIILLFIKIILIDTLTYIYVGIRHCVARGNLLQQERYVWKINVRPKLKCRTTNMRSAIIIIAIFQRIFPRGFCAMCSVLMIKCNHVKLWVIIIIPTASSPFITDKWPMIFSDFCRAYAFYALHMVMAEWTVRAHRRSLITSVTVCVPTHTKSVFRNET